MSATPLPSRRLFLGMAAAVPLSTTGVLTLGSQAANAATTSPFVMAYFTQSPRNLGTDYGLHLAVSTDALQWMPLNQNNPVVTYVKNFTRRVLIPESSVASSLPPRA